LESTLTASNHAVPVAAHVGHNCLRDAQTLATHAEASGAAAIAEIIFYVFLVLLEPL